MTTGLPSACSIASITGEVRRAVQEMNKPCASGQSMRVAISRTASGSTRLICESSSSPRAKVRTTVSPRFSISTRIASVTVSE